MRLTVDHSTIDWTSLAAELLLLTPDFTGILKVKSSATFTSKVGHIAVESTDLLLNLKAKVDSTFAGKFNELVVMATDAIALLGHASFELSQLRRGYQVAPSQGLWRPLFPQRACDRAPIWRRTANPVDPHTRYQ